MKSLTRSLTMGIAAMIIFGACSKTPVEQPAPRPVRVMEVAAQSGETPASLAGELRARYEMRVGFRVAGKIAGRYVNVGDRLKPGTLIAELDPVDYRLAVEALMAQLSGAQAELAFAAADRQRYRELQQQGFISPAEFERRDTAAKTLRDRVAAIQAQLEQGRNQVQYTRLIADHTAVVVSVLAEADQIVTAGQTVVVLARPEEVELAVDVPEHLRDQWVNARHVAISFWARPEARLEGRVREVSASADPASRTYATRIALLRRPDWTQLGMSATASISGMASEAYAIPASAVFQPHGDLSGPPRVWVLSPDGTLVRSAPVELGVPAGANEVIVKGLTAGQRIVTAGTSRLREGEAIRIVQPSDVGGPAVQREGFGNGAPHRTTRNDALNGNGRAPR